MHHRLFSLLVFLAVLALPDVARPGPAESFVELLDAHFGGDPNRAIVLAREELDRRRNTPLREPTLYVLGRSFASIHLYEKAADAFHAVLVDYPDGQYAPYALRELCRMFFDLREWTAVVYLDHDKRRRLPDGRVPEEVHYLIGQAYYLLGDKNAEARANLREVGFGSVFYPFAQYTLAQTEFRLGEASAAAARLDQVRRMEAAPRLLRDNATRALGMVLYQQGRFRDAVGAFRAIGETSPLHPVSRVDVALASEALGDNEGVERALREAMDSQNELLRAEARVAFGRLFTRGGDPAKARVLFQEAVDDLRARESRLRRGIDSNEQFRAVFDELVTFARRSRADERNRGLAQDLALLASTLRTATGTSYQHPLPEAGQSFVPESDLFGLLHEHFHDVPLIEEVVDLTVEMQELRDQLSRFRKKVGGLDALDPEGPPVARSAVPDRARETLDEAFWILMARYDLVARLYNELYLNERLGLEEVTAEKRRALWTTVEGLRLLESGDRSLPTDAGLRDLMSRARSAIQGGTIPGLESRKIREGMLVELSADEKTLHELVENLRLKDRQMNAAIEGIPVRSRNLNLPVFTVTSQWLEALEHMVGKYRHVGVPRDKRPWHLAGRAREVEQFFLEAERDLASLEERAFRVLRSEAHTLIEREQKRHSYVVAQAEEGVADALFQERGAR